VGKCPPQILKIWQNFLKQFLFAGLSFITVSGIMRKAHVAMMDMPTCGRCPSTP